MTTPDPNLPTVIALHCSGATGRQWHRLAAMVSPHAHFIALDLTGCGADTSHDGRPATSLMDEAAPVIEMIDASLGPLHLVGHSYGGAVALRAALERPNHVASLALYEPSAFSLLRGLGAAGNALHDEVAALAFRIRKQMNEGRHAEAMRGFYDYWQGEGAWGHLPHDTRLALAARVLKIPSDFDSLFADAMQLRQLRRLAIPTLVIMGETSPGPSRMVADRIARAIPKGRTIELAGAGHMGPVTHREIVAATITAHLGFETPAGSSQATLAA